MTTKASDNHCTRVSLDRLPMLTNGFFGRDEELNKLSNAIKSTNRRIVFLSGDPGNGKSSLVMKWLLKIRKENYLGSQFVFGWSFNQQHIFEDTYVSSDDLFLNALNHLTDRELYSCSPWENGKLFANFCAEKNAIVVLDGLETIQHTNGNKRGWIKDPAIDSFLSYLLGNTRGTCIITSRISMLETQENAGDSFLEIPVDRFSIKDSKYYLASLMLDLNDDLCNEIVSALDGHPFSLSLIGSFIKQFGKEKTNNIGLGINLNNAELLVEAFENKFRNRNRSHLNQILLLLAFFDGPVDEDTIEYLRSKQPPVQSITNKLTTMNGEWSEAVEQLRDCNLLSLKNPFSDIERLDYHAVVRQYYSRILSKEKLAKDAQKLHNRVSKYYASKITHSLNTLEELSCLYNSVRHACAAKRYKYAFDELYLKRIRKEEEAYNIDHFGSYGEDLDVLQEFIGNDHNIIDQQLSHREDIIYSFIGFNLRALGRLEEAIPWMKKAFLTSMRKQDYPNSVRGADILSHTYLIMGNFEEALRYSYTAVTIAEQYTAFDEIGAAFLSMNAFANLAHAQHQVGLVGSAALNFRQAEEKHAYFDKSKCLRSAAGYRYCDYLIDQGHDINDIKQRVLEALSHDELEGYNPPDNLVFCHPSQTVGKITPRAFSELSLANVIIYQIEEEKDSDHHLLVEEAEKHLAEAIGLLRGGGVLHELPRALITHAKLNRISGNYEISASDLREAKYIAARGAMKLYLVDINIENAKLLFEMNNHEQSDELVRTSITMASEIGYSRSINEIHRFLLASDNTISINMKTYGKSVHNDTYLYDREINKNDDVMEPDQDRDYRDRQVHDNYQHEYEKELNLFEKALPKLLEKYEGKHVAMINGKVIDHDEDDDVLFARVYSTKRDTYVFICKVISKSEDDLIAYCNA